MTLEYYNANAAAFRDRTRSFDLSGLYERFLGFVKAGGRILDAGCGPGRDMRVFLSRGYEVVGIDGSVAMVELARQETKGEVRMMRFDEIEFVKEFDGVWANASLLHVSGDKIDDVLARLIGAMKVGAGFYMSVKQGQGKRMMADGRIFWDYQERTLREVLARHGELEMVEVWETEARVGQSDQRNWLHALGKRKV